MTDIGCITLTPITGCTVDTETCYCETIVTAPFTFKTNPDEVCGVSTLWEVGASAAGPWSPAFDINNTCGLTSTASIAGIGWIAETANGVATGPGPMFYRSTFTLDAAQHAAISSGFVGPMAGDPTMTAITLNGTTIYSGTPPQDFGTIANVDLPSTAAVVGVNEFIVEVQFGGVGSDGFTMDLALTIADVVAVAYRKVTYTDPGACPDAWFDPDDNPIAEPNPLPTLECPCTFPAFFISQDPVDQAVANPGDTAQFTAASTGGMPPVTGQWEEFDGTNWVDIAGETATTLDVTEGP